MTNVMHAAWHGRVHRAALHRTRGATMQVRSTTAPELSAQMAAMPDIPMTRHAAHRLKNRGISLEQVLVVADFGVSQRSHGATRFALDRKTRQLMVETVCPAFLRRLGSLDIVAVFGDDGALVTASHRTERLRRDITRH